jgi:hypothetical protein
LERRGGEAIPPPQHWSSRAPSQPSGAKVSIHEDVAEFFLAYVEAFNRDDAATIGELWDEVGLFPSPTGNFAMEREVFRAHCVGLMEFYRRQGVVRAEARLLSATELFPDVAQARWPGACAASRMISSPPGSMSTSCAAATGGAYP